MAEDFVAIVRAELDQTSLYKLNNDINAINNGANRPTILVKAEFDRSSYDRINRQLNDLLERLRELSNLRIQLGGTGSSRSGLGGNAIKQAYNDLLILQERMKATTELMNNAAPNSTRYNDLHSSLNNLWQDYWRLYEIASKYLSTQQKANLDRNDLLPTTQSRVLREELTNINQEFDEMRKMASRISKLSLKIQGLDEAGPEYAEIKQQLDGLIDRYHALQQATQGQLTTAQMATLSKSMNELDDNIRIVNAHADELAAKKIANEEFKNFINDVQKASSLELKIHGLDAQKNANELAELNKQLEVYRQRIAEYMAAHPDADMSKANKIFQETADSITLINSKLRDKDALKEYEAQWNEVIQTVEMMGKLKVQRAGLDPKRNANEYNALTKEIGRLESKYLSLVKTMGTLPADKQEQLNKLLQEIGINVDLADARFRDLGTTVSRIGNAFKSSFASAAMYMFSGHQVFRLLSRGVRDAYKNIVEIDSAMTELKKVTDETGAAYDAFLAGAGKAAVRIGSTVTDYINSTADFARLGYNFVESQDLARVANIYSVVGDEIESIDDASQSVISTMAAFGIEAEDAMSIIDKFNEVGNNFAISSGGIGEALQRSAAAMSTANATLDESIALIAAANTVVQNPESVGTALKTLSARMRGSKTELEEMGEATDDLASSTSKLRDEIMALTGVDIMLDENTFKSPYLMLQEMSKVWDTLTDVSRANVLELLGGKRQANVLSAIIKNFDIAENALEKSSNSAGSALQEHEKWLESIEAKTNQLKASWQALSKDFINSELVKVGLGFLTRFASLLDSIINLTGGAGFVGAIAALTGIVKLIRATKAEGVTSLLGAFSSLSGFTKIASIVGSLTLAISLVVNAIKRQKEEQRKAWQESIEAGKAAAEERDKIESLYETYNRAHDAYVSGTGTKEDLDTATIELLESLGYEEDQIDNLILKYGNLEDAIRGVTEAKLEETFSELADAYSSAQKALDDFAKDKITGGWKDMTWIEDSTNTAKKLNDVLQKYNFITSGNKSNYGATFTLPSDPIEAYEKLLDMQKVLTEAVRNGELDLSMKELMDTDLWSTISKKIGEASKYVEDYRFAVENLNNASLKINLHDYEKSFGDIDTLEEFNAFYQDLISNIKEGSTLFVGSIGEQRDAVDSFIASTPELLEFYKQTEEYANKMSAQYREGFIAEALGRELTKMETIVSRINGTEPFPELEELLKWFDGLELDKKALVVEIGVQNATSSLWDLDQWINALTHAESVVETTSSSISEFYNLLKNDDKDTSFTANIEKQQDRINSLIEIRNNLGKYMTNEARYSLVLQFPELAGHTNDINDLDNAIKQLIEDSYGNIDNEFLKSIEELGAISPESAEALRNLHETYKSLREDYGVKGFSQYESEYSSVLSAANSGFEAGGMKPEDVQNIVSVYGKLRGFDYRTLFENTAQGIQVNVNALRILNKEYVAQQKLKMSNALKDLTLKYKSYQQQLEKTTDAQERENIENQIALIEAKYKAIQMEQAAYEGLTSAFNEWQKAQKQTDARNAWEQSGKGLENIQTLIESGWVNDAEVIAYANRFLEIGDRITSWQELSDSMWANMVNTSKRYYTENASGLETFLEDLISVQGETDWVTKLADGTYDINVGIGDMIEIASKLTGNLDGIQLSSENILEIFKALSEVGWVELPDDWDKPIEEATVDVQELTESIEEAQDQSRQHTMLNLDSQKAWADVEKLRNELRDLALAAKEDKKIKLNTDEAVSKLQELNEKLAALKDKDIRVNVYTGTLYNKTGGYNGSVSGPIFANGTAFAKGNWGTKKSGVALVGELGREIVVRDGQYFTVGDNGAEFFKYKQNDIIFNAAQSEEILKYGGTKGRGKALLQGTAFATGATGNVWFPKKNETNNTSSSSSSSSSRSSSSSSSNSSSSEEKEFEETLDWIEVKINRVERAISNLDRIVSSTYRTWSTRNTSLANEIEEIVNEIGIAQAGYNRYIAEANSVGLSEDWASKVRDGLIDIDTILDEDLADKIKKYQEWYEKAIDLKDKIEDLKETEASLYKQRFDNVATEYEGFLSLIEHERNMLDESIAQTEARGYIVSENYYKALQKTEEGNIKKLEAEKTALLSELQNAVASGTIKKESEAWYEMIASIDGVTEAIAQANTQLIEYSNNIRDIRWQVFDLIEDRMARIADEADFFISLMDENLYTDNGQLNKRGMAVMGMHAEDYNVYMAQSAKYAQEIKKLNKDIANDPYNQELINRREELLELQRDSILAAEDEKKAIRDMVKEGIDLELDSLNELIDAYKEGLDSQKDLYEYQKKVAEQTKEIAKLEKQLAAYQGDNSEENRARLQKIQTQLGEARQNLQETQYDKMINDQKTMLDELYTQYEEVLNSRLDDINVLISDMIVMINDNAVSISQTLSDEAKSVGYTMTDEMKAIWDKASVKSTDVVEEINNGILNGTTTLNNTLGAINTNIANMISTLNTKAQQDVKVATTSTAAKTPQASGKSSSATTTPSKTTPSSQKSSTSSSSSTSTTKANGRTDQENYGVALAIWNGNYGWGNGIDRKNRLEAKGFNYATVQAIITQMDKDGYVHKGTWQGKYYGITSLAPYHYNKFALGAKNIGRGQLAWTQENGLEYIVSPSSGAILTPLSRGDSVLNAQASKNIWDMANTPNDFILDALKSKGGIPNALSGNGSYTQNFENVVFSLPNVKNYDELIRQMQRDRNFERLIQSMTDGGSPLNKYKAVK